MITKEQSHWRWNPFTTLGETPSGLRFKSEPDELEFASKEDLELIKANPQLSKVHQSMLAGVNKKMQTSAEEKKTLQKQIEMLQAQIAELDAGLSEWENTYITHKDAIDTALKGDQLPPDTKKKKVKTGEGEDELDKKIEQLVTAINQAGTHLEKRIGKAERMLSLSLQLNDLYRKNPQMDGDKVLDAALKSGEVDLSRVYNDVYHDDILNQELEKRIQPRVDEELLKRQTKVETGSGATPLKFEIAKEGSKSWTDLSQDFLKEQAEESAKGGKAT